MRRPALVSDRPRYRRISTCMWGDEKFRKLSPPQPNAQWLWLFLLCGPQTRAVPGLCSIGEAALAEMLGWPLPRFRRCWWELEAAEMARADWRARVVWIPNAIRHNEPESPNVVNAWRQAVSEIPECELKHEAICEIQDYLETMGPEWVTAWAVGRADWDPLDERARRALRTNETLRADIKQRDQDRCRYCGQTVNWRDRRGPMSGTYDHVDPGGSTTFANLVTACRSCNSKKRRRTPEQAGMQLLDPGRDLGPNLGPIRNQDQDQDQDQDQELREGVRTGKPSPDERRFERFWAVYPKKDGRKDALKWWLKSPPSEALTKKIIAGVNVHLATKGWRDAIRSGDLQFIPNPERYLDGARWEDLTVRGGLAAAPTRPANCRHTQPCASEVDCTSRYLAEMRGTETTPELVS